MGDGDAMDSGKRGAGRSWEGAGRSGRRETVVRMYCMRQESIFNNFDLQNYTSPRNKLKSGSMSTLLYQNSANY